MNFSRGALLLTALIAFLSAVLPARAQTTNGNGDRIVAVVGRNRIILKSDLEQQAQQLQQQNSMTEPVTDSMKCLLLQDMILQKMLVEQAERDSLLVTDEQVEGNLDNRVRQFMRMYGGKEKLEQLSGKTIYQMKEDNREIIKESMMAEQMRSKLMEHVKVTPGEVQAFFNKIPVDSLPFYPATIEVGEVVIDPPINPELDQLARTKLEDIRKQIVTDGKSFETMAGLYSQDPGSRDNGGRMDGVTREAVVPEFAKAAFRLQNGEVSPIVKTQYGYHIIQMIQRKGDQVDLRHILIIPEHTSGDYTAALGKLDSIRAQIISGKITFTDAVTKYSTDQQTKLTAGMLTDGSSGATNLRVDQLDPSLALNIDSLKPGVFSQPQLFRNAQGEQSARIIFVKSRTEPHKANLRDDYSQIQGVALARKQQDHLNSWVSERLPSYYLRIDPVYGSCDALQHWSAQSTTGKK